MTVAAYLSLGANLGDRLETLTSAVYALDDTDGIAVVDTSGVYETAPWGGVDQPAYLNLVVHVATTLSPEALLAELQLTEAAYGRDRSSEVRFGPRALDIDILLYGDDTVARPDLEIPHPRLTERAFVLVPLLEVAPGLTLPDGSRITAHLNRLAPIEGVELHVRLDEVPRAGGSTRPAGPASPGPVPGDQWSQDAAARATRFALEERDGS